jgi:hypothetical protein
MGDAIEKIENPYTVRLMISEGKYTRKLMENAGFVEKVYGSIVIIPK